MVSRTGSIVGSYARDSALASKKNLLPFDRYGGVVTTQRRLFKSRAYLGLSAQAKALLQLLHVEWRPDRPIGYGVREAEAKIPCSRKTAMRAFHDLVERGFIVMVDESLFCSRSQSKTRTWRLTWLPWNHNAPTNNWEKWTPSDEG